MIKRNGVSDLPTIGQVCEVNALSMNAKILSKEEVIAQLRLARLINEQGMEKLRKLDVPTGVHLVGHLMKRQQMTRFQADAILQGRAALLDLGDYYITDYIGKGSFCTVYRAVHRHLERTVAVKVMNPEAMASKEGHDRFLKEAKALARLKHDALVTLFDACFYNQRYYLAMEMVEGSTLEGFVRKFGPLDVDSAMDFIEQAAAGLRHAHHEGVLHRDIKPSNMILATNSRIRILDLGVTKLTQKFKRKSSIASGPKDQMPREALVGTVDYMAPEQAFDVHNADERADIYSLGCTLFFLLTGRSVFQGETPLKVLMRHQNDPRPSLRAERKEVPVALDKLFQKMIAVKAEDRFRTMGDVVRELQAIPKTGSQAHAALTNPQISLPQQKDVGGASDYRGPADIPSESVLSLDDYQQPDAPDAIPSRLQNVKPPGLNWPLTAGLVVVAGLALFGGLFAAGYFTPPPPDLGGTMARSGETPEPQETHGTIQLSFSDPTLAQDVRLDGERLTTTEQQHAIRLTAGKHHLLVDGPETVPLNHWFDVVGGTSIQVHAALERDAASGSDLTRKQKGLTIQ